MKKPLYDHSWIKMIEGRFEPGLARTMINIKIKEINDIAEKIRKVFGDDSAQNVLNLTYVQRSLSQCLAFIDKTNLQVTEEDYYIYYSFATTKIKAAEKLIDDELKELGL